MVNHRANSETSIGKALAFPDSRPDQYSPLTGEPEFNADIHLSLSQPDDTVSLSDLGYLLSTGCGCMRIDICL